LRRTDRDRGGDGSRLVDLSGSGGDDACRFDGSDCSHRRIGALEYADKRVAPAFGQDSAALPDRLAGGLTLPTEHEVDRSLRQSRIARAPADGENGDVSRLSPVLLQVGARSAELVDGRVDHLLLTQCGPDSGQELSVVDGLREKVVCPSLDATHAVFDSV